MFLSSCRFRLLDSMDLAFRFMDILDCPGKLLLTCRSLVPLGTFQQSCRLGRGPAASPVCCIFTSRKECYGSSYFDPNEGNLPQYVNPRDLDISASDSFPHLAPSPPSTDSDLVNKDSSWHCSEQQFSRFSPSASVDFS